MNMTRCRADALTSSQPWNPAASAKIPAAAVKATSAISQTLSDANAFADPISSRALSAGRQHEDERYQEGRYWCISSTASSCGRDRLP